MSLFGTNTVASHWGWQNRWYETGPIVPPWSSSPQLITASDGQANDYFGTSVDMSGTGNYCVIGAPRDDTSTFTDNGSAYVYIKTGSTFVQQAKLVASDAGNLDLFGTSVGINSTGDTIIVGAKIDSPSFSQQGSAYIFTRTGTTWTQQAKLLANNPQTNSYFGTSVSISADGNTAVVGAEGASSNSIYVYIRNGTNWTRQQTITGPSTTFYGCSVSISADGNTIIVGAKAESISSTRVGTAYIYTRASGVWSLQQKLFNPVGNNFGAYVNISGDGNTVVIGSDNINSVISKFTGPHVYTRSVGVWTLAYSIGANFTENNSEQPSLNYSGTALVVTGDGQALAGGGEIRFYSGGGSVWNLDNTVNYIDPLSDPVCNALDDIGSTMIIGIQSSDVLLNNAGASYIYTK